MRFIGFVEGKFPVTYLGVPLVLGRLTSRDFDPLVRKIKNKMTRLKLRLLSQGARLVLLRHVLTCMATHLLAILQVLMVVFKKNKFAPIYISLREI